MPGGGLDLIDEVEKAGLRGRGGASFPTGVKLRSVASGRRGFVVANGTEREPVSRKDRVLLAGSPHLVLDGLSIAAETVGAAEAILCIDRSATTALAVVGTALRERDRAGADHIPIRLEATPGPYVTGEESALVHWINGGDAKPTFVPPRPYERGVKGRPTLVNNVETLANLALIARFRAEWFRGLGTAKDPGSALITVSGDVGRAGVYEVSLGSGLSSVVRSAGPHGKPKALLVGGYAGVWIDAAGADKLTLDSVSLASVKAAVGCGAVAVLGPDACGLQETAAIARWLADESAGQCGPCVHGLPAIAHELDVLVAGDRRGTARRRLAQLLDVVAGRGACHHPDGAVKMVRSALAVFAGEIETHRRHGPCRVRHSVLPLPARSAGWR
jgi:NADH:ubiquinone oxidoreductase subunit F (NADH-binding)